MNRAATRAVLDRRGLRLRKELGQNFLVDEGQAARLVDLAGVREGDAVLEIGTGLGALTRALADRAARVVTVEIDSGVARALREDALIPDEVELIHADALALDLGALLGDAPPARARVVANLPYSSATPLLRRLLDLRERFASWSVMVQREVALRLVAEEGGRDYGSLAVLHALTTRIELRAELPAECFFPTPKVVSSFVHVEPLAPAEVSNDELRRIERVVRALFQQRRKTLWNGLRRGGFVQGTGGAAEGGTEALLAELGIDPRTRAETVAPAALRALVAGLHARGIV